MANRPLAKETTPRYDGANPYHHEVDRQSDLAGSQLLAGLSASHRSFADLKSPSQAEQELAMQRNKHFCDSRRVSIFFECLLVVFGIAAIVQLWFIPSAIEKTYYNAVDDRFVMTAGKQKKNNSAYDVCCFVLF